MWLISNLKRYFSQEDWQEIEELVQMFGFKVVQGKFVIAERGAPIFEIEIEDIVLN